VVKRFLALVFCTLMLPMAAAASQAGRDVEDARTEFLSRIDNLQRAAEELELFVDPDQFSKLRHAIRALDDIELDLLAHAMSHAESAGPVTDTIAFPDPEIIAICEPATPGAGYGLYILATALDQILAAAKWVCLQTALGTNLAATCTVFSAAAVAAQFLFAESELCLSIQRSAYQGAIFETQSNIADQLNLYIDATISSRASQSSLNDLQTGVSQELADLNTLANRLASDLSDLSADFTDTSNSIASLTSATLDMTSVSQDIGLKTLITQAEAEEIDDFAADTQERMETIRTRTLQISASVESLEALIDGLNINAETQIARELEASLARAMADPNFNIVRYKLPASMNGELERSREVLVRTLLAFDGIGVDTSAAAQYLTLGDQQFNLGRYLTAYDHFSTAYQMLLGQSGIGAKDK
jgi:hypothetical protein